MPFSSELSRTPFDRRSAICEYPCGAFTIFSSSAVPVLLYGDLAQRRIEAAHRMTNMQDNSPKCPAKPISESRSRWVQRACRLLLCWTPSASLAGAPAGFAEIKSS
jgi:hypothetical protein